MQRPLLHMRASPPVEVVGEATWRIGTAFAAAAAVVPSSSGGAPLQQPASSPRRAGRQNAGNAGGAAAAAVQPSFDGSSATPSPLGSPKLDTGVRVQSLLLAHVLSEPVATGAKRAQKARPPGQGLQAALGTLRADIAATATAAAAPGARRYRDLPPQLRGVYDELLRGRAHSSSAAAAAGAHTAAGSSVPVSSVPSAAPTAAPSLAPSRAVSRTVSRRGSLVISLASAAAAAAAAPSPAAFSPSAMATAGMRSFAFPFSPSATVATSSPSSSSSFPTTTSSATTVEKPLLPRAAVLSLAASGAVTLHADLDKVRLEAPPRAVRVSLNRQNGSLADDNNATTSSAPSAANATTATTTKTPTPSPRLAARKLSVHTNKLGGSAVPRGNRSPGRSPSPSRGSPSRGAVVSASRPTSPNKPSVHSVSPTSALSARKTAGSKAVGFALPSSAQPKVKMSPQMKALQEELERQTAQTAQAEATLAAQLAHAARPESVRLAEEAAARAARDALPPSPPPPPLPLVPFAAQGDLELYSASNVAQRVSNKYAPAFVRRTYKFFRTLDGLVLPGSAAAQGKMNNPADEFGLGFAPRGSFIKLLILLYAHLHAGQEDDAEQQQQQQQQQNQQSPEGKNITSSKAPLLSEEQLSALHAALSQDLRSDLSSSGSVSGLSRLVSFPEFHEALFQLTDLWSLGVGLADYTTLLDTLYNVVTRQLSEKEVKNRGAKKKKNAASPSPPTVPRRASVVWKANDDGTIVAISPDEEEEDEEKAAASDTMPVQPSSPTGINVPMSASDARESEADVIAAVLQAEQRFRDKHEQLASGHSSQTGSSTASTVSIAQRMATRASRLRELDLIPDRPVLTAPVVALDQAALEEVTNAALADATKLPDKPLPSPPALTGMGFSRVRSALLNAAEQEKRAEVRLKARREAAEAAAAATVTLSAVAPIVEDDAAAAPVASAPVSAPVSDSEDDSATSSSSSKPRMVMAQRNNVRLSVESALGRWSIGGSDASTSNASTGPGTGNPSPLQQRSAASSALPSPRGAPPSQQQQQPWSRRHSSRSTAVSPRSKGSSALPPSFANLRILLRENEGLVPFDPLHLETHIGVAADGSLQGERSPLRSLLRRRRRDEEEDMSEDGAEEPVLSEHERSSNSMSALSPRSVAATAGSSPSGALSPRSNKAVVRRRHHRRHHSRELHVTRPAATRLMPLPPFQADHTLVAPGGHRLRSAEAVARQQATLDAARESMRLDALRELQSGQQRGRSSTGIVKLGHSQGIMVERSDAEAERERERVAQRLEQLQQAIKEQQMKQQQTSSAPSPLTTIQTPRMLWVPLDPAGNNASASSVQRRRIFTSLDDNDDDGDGDDVEDRENAADADMYVVQDKDAPSMAFSNLHATGTAMLTRKQREQELLSTRNAYFDPACALGAHVQEQGDPSGSAFTSPSGLPLFRNSMFGPGKRVPSVRDGGGLLLYCDSISDRNPVVVATPFEEKQQHSDYLKLANLAPQLRSHSATSARPLSSSEAGSSGIIRMLATTTPGTLARSARFPLYKSAHRRPATAAATASAVRTLDLSDAMQQNMLAAAQVESAKSEQSTWRSLPPTSASGSAASTRPQSRSGIGLSTAAVESAYPSGSRTARVLSAASPRPASRALDSGAATGGFPAARWSSAKPFASPFADSDALALEAADLPPQRSWHPAPLDPAVAPLHVQARGVSVRSLEASHYGALPAAAPTTRRRRRRSSNTLAQPPPEQEGPMLRAKRV